jgi:hypothetical protein
MLAGAHALRSPYIALQSLSTTRGLRECMGVQGHGRGEYVMHKSQAQLMLHRHSHEVQHTCSTWHFMRACRAASSGGCCDERCRGHLPRWPLARMADMMSCAAVAIHHR